MKIFLSYSRDSTKLARELAKQLKERGNSVWLGLEELAPGSHWAAEVRNAVRDADGVVFLVTPGFAQSDHAALEVALAVSTRASDRKAIIPVRIGRIKSNPPLLDQFTYLDGSELNVDKMAQELSDALEARRNVDDSRELNQAAEALDASTQVLREEVERQAGQLNNFSRRRLRDLLLPLISGLLGVLSSVLVNLWSLKGSSMLIAVSVIAISGVAASLVFYRLSRAASGRGGSNNE